MFDPNSRNNRRQNAKRLAAGILDAGLADAIDLALMTKHAHWNVKGPHFLALHELFDRFSGELDTHVDTMAERIVQLGGNASDTSQSIVRRTRLAPYPVDIRDGEAHVAALAERYAAVGEALRGAIDRIAAAEDAATADILTAFLRAIDKALWFLEAHLHGAAQAAAHRVPASVAVAMRA